MGQKPKWDIRKNIKEIFKKVMIEKDIINKWADKISNEDALRRLDDKKYLA